MPNVVMITPGFAVDENDLVCVPFLQLYLHDLLKHGINLHIIATQYPAKENYTWHGIPVSTITKKEPKLISKICFNYRLKAILKGIHKAQKTDVLHQIWFSETVPLVNRHALNYHIKHLITFSGQDVLPENKALKSLGSFKGKLVCVSLFQQLKFKTHYTYDTEIIHWGTETIETADQLRPIDLISCGWINVLKNHSQFVDIVYELHQLKQIHRAVICGDGSELVSLRRKIKTLRLEHIIELKGSLPRPEVIRLMKQSRVLVHTSSYEGFGLVLAEGLACGCKVASTPVGIAFDHELISRCTTTSEFVTEIIKQMKGPESTGKPINTYPIKRTSERYLELYKA